MERLLKSNRLGLTLAAAVLTALALAIHWNVLRHDSFVDLDDPSLVLPMLKVHGVSDYLHLREAGQILDVQPVRDLSYWLDWQVKKAAGISVFHASNWLAWLISVFLFFGVARRSGASRNVAAAATLAFGLHPALAVSVAWISARKHLLAWMFAFAATYVFLDGKRSLRGRILVPIFYALSCFSQPIAILWPVWAFFAEKPAPAELAKRKDRLQFLALFGIGAFAAWLNLRYYTGPYVEQSFGLPKLAASQGAARPLLAFGRYLVEIAMPAWTCAPPHWPDALLDLAGLAGFAIVCLACRAVTEPAALRRWLGFYVLALLPVTAVSTQVFVSDTYALGAAFAFFQLVAASTPGILERLSRPVARSGMLAFFLLGMPLLTLASWKQSQALVSEFDLWERAYEADPAPWNATHLAAVYLGRNETAELGRRIAATANDQAGGRISQVCEIFARSVFLDESASPASRAQLLGARPCASPWHRFYLARLRLAAGETEQARSTLPGTFVEPSLLLRDRDSIEQYYALAFWGCALGGGKNDCTAQIDKVRSAHLPLGRAWSEPAFQTALSQLRAR